MISHDQLQRYRRAGFASRQTRLPELRRLQDLLLFEAIADDTQVFVRCCVRLPDELAADETSMPLSRDITLPAGIRPTFPNKCIVCHEIPDSSLKIAQNSANPFLSFFMPVLLFFGWSRVTVPICRGCKPRYRMQRWGRFVIMAALMGIAVWWILPMLGDHFPRPVRKVIAGVLVMTALLPWFLFDIFWPRYFDTQAWSKTTIYEFASLDYGIEFAVLNRDHVIVPD